MSKKILVVDDTTTIRMFERLILSSQGYEISEAGNGQEALQQVKAVQPDLVLLDIEMPVMDGIECCKRLKSEPATKDIPILMLTTRSEMEKVEEAKAAGCNGYLTKPIKKIELISKVKKHLEEQ